MKNILLFLAVVCVTITSKAQMYEAGIFVGGSNYIGDVGSETELVIGKAMRDASG